MKFIRQLSTLILFILVNISIAKAASFPIVSITRDDSDLTYKLIIDSADEQIIDQVRKETYQKGQLVNNEILDSNSLPTGIVLEEQKGYKALVLKGQNFDMVYGGEIEVDTLFSGVTLERRSYFFDLAKSNRGWGIYKNNKLIKTMEIKVNKVPLLGVIGIKDLIAK